MKVAIVYSTRGGTTRECAELLAKEMKNDTVELFEIGEGEPDYSKYDICVVGFPIRMAKAEKKARQFLKKNAEMLKQMKTAYFLCCGFVDCFEEYAEKCIDKELRDSAVAIYCLGGSLDPDRFKGLDRIIVKMVRTEILSGGENADQRDDLSLPTVMEENISQFADELRRAMV